MFDLVRGDAAGGSVPDRGAIEGENGVKESAAQSTALRAGRSHSDGGVSASNHNASARIAATEILTRRTAPRTIIAINGDGLAARLDMA